MEGLAKEVESLCKHRKDARLAYIRDPKNKHKRNLVVI